MERNHGRLKPRFFKTGSGILVEFAITVDISGQMDMSTEKWTLVDIHADI
jgi:hypothetical protein